MLLAGQDLVLVVLVGIAEVEAQEEAVELRLGKGKVPSSSIGFCVAMTRKGRGRSVVSPSTVSWRSSIASRRAACVRGVARLISSARTIWAMSGPSRKAKSCAF